MPDLRIDFNQKMQQQMKLSPQMIQSVELLRLPVEELCDRVYQEAEKNPAIEILKDADLSIRSVTSLSKHTNASDTFQSFLENTADHEESLQEHLLFQLSMLELSKEEINLGERIIQNLDSNGFFSATLENLLYPHETKDLLDHTLNIVRTLDPQGIAFSNVQESLLFQAENHEQKNPLAIEILKNHFDVLEKKRAGLIKKHLHDNTIDCTLEEVEGALEFIKKLEPYPARNFNEVNASVLYVIPDVIVRKKDNSDNDDNDSDNAFVIEFLKGSLPEITVSGVYTNLLNDKNITKETQHFATESVQNAKQFIQALSYRTSSIYHAVQIIVSKQYDFFCKGPGHLVPLRQKDIAEEIGAHETTISRIANGKYLQCDWGIFELKYFFTNAVHHHNSYDGEQHDSKESIKHQIQLLLQENEKEGGKKLSDSKLSTMLEQKGIVIARRTVAKYRGELNIESSFDRL